jgi:hypothetical protein
MQNRNDASDNTFSDNRSAQSCIAIRGAGLEAVAYLLASARRLEGLAMAEQANRLRKLADLVAAEYCYVALDYHRHPHRSPLDNSIEHCSPAPFGPGRPALAPLVGKTV